MKRMKPDYSLFSDRGSRAVNEDYADAFFRRGASCFVLYDGLGAHGMGDRASRFVTQFIKREFAKSSGLASLETVLPRAQEALRAEQVRLGAVGRMRTTAVVLLLDGSSGMCVHIGDSRLYRFRGGELLSRTRDHSVPQMLALTGEIEESEIRSHPDRSKLLRALGDERETIKYETARFDVRAGDVFLLCSDGFWEPVTEDEMISLLRESANAKQWLSRMSRLAARNSAGKLMDNYTAVAVFIK